MNKSVDDADWTLILPGRCVNSATSITLFGVAANCASLSFDIASHAFTVEPRTRLSAAALLVGGKDAFGYDNDIERDAADLVDRVDDAAEIGMRI